ncbi:MAG: hypothetical protein ACT4OE_11245 [Sphingosinicella sp.]
MLAALGFNDRVAQDTALANARTVVLSAHGRYALARFQFEIARLRGDITGTNAAVDALVASGHASDDELAGLLAHQAARAFFAGNQPAAERLMSRAADAAPNDPVLLAEVAQLKSRIGGALLQAGRRSEAGENFQQAARLLQRAIDIQRTAGQVPPEGWYKRATALAFDYGMRPQSVAFARGLVHYYPTPGNWRDALFTYRRAIEADAALELDIRRLHRATQSLSGERDYIEFAEALRANHAGEMKAVLDEGVNRGMLSASEPIVRQLVAANARRATAEQAGLARQRTQAQAAAGAAARAAGDAFFGHGRYAEAAELYLAALQKGGEDANLVNSRLGAAYALAGQRAEAEAALRAVTGPRADLAAFWLIWLSRQGS